MQLKDCFRALACLIGPSCLAAGCRISTLSAPSCSCLAANSFNLALPQHTHSPMFSTWSAKSFQIPRRWSVARSLGLSVFPGRSAIIPRRRGGAGGARSAPPALPTAESDRTAPPTAGTGCDTGRPWRNNGRSGAARLVPAADIRMAPATQTDDQRWVGAVLSPRPDAPHPDAPRRPRRPPRRPRRPGTRQTDFLSGLSGRDSLGYDGSIHSGIRITSHYDFLVSFMYTTK